MIFFNEIQLSSSNICKHKPKKFENIYEIDLIENYLLYIGNFNSKCPVWKNMLKM